MRFYTLAVFGIVPEHCYDEAAYGENPVGSGRYILTQWDKRAAGRFGGESDYYGDEVQMKKVIVLFMEGRRGACGGKSGSGWTSPTRLRCTATSRWTAISFWSVSRWIPEESRFRRFRRAARLSTEIPCMRRET